MMGMQEKPGSTRIISILPEGTKVKAGDVVCELDSSAFHDELQAQKIRYAQAKAIVDQVQAILEVTAITQLEYREGIHPQDSLLIRQYQTSCRIEEQRARKNFEWSKDVAAKGFRSPSQVKADELALDQAKFALSEAEGMSIRLDKYTAPKLLKNLEAKLEAIRADKLAQEQILQNETSRMRRLEKAVAKCTLRAPRDGIVVYANLPNSWGRVESQIEQGVTVREGQPVVLLPDPRDMRVRARINESKVSLIHKGMRAHITVDAFHDRTMTGTVDEVTPIPAPANGPVSDVRVYFATVKIDGEGYDDLRPGLSADVHFLVNVNKKVTRVPLRAIRWVDNLPFAAVASNKQGSGKIAGSRSWEWRRVDLGQSDSNFAEVLSGLKVGERVVAKPELLPAPEPKAESTTVADASDSSRR